MKAREYILPVLAVYLPLVAIVLGFVVLMVTTPKTAVNYTTIKLDDGELVFVIVKNEYDFDKFEYEGFEYVKYNDTWLELYDNDYNQVTFYFSVSEIIAWGIDK